MMSEEDNDSDNSAVIFLPVSRVRLDAQAILLSLAGTNFFCPPHLHHVVQDDNPTSRITSWLTRTDVTVAKFQKRDLRILQLTLSAKPRPSTVGPPEKTGVAFSLNRCEARREEAVWPVQGTAC